MGKGQPSKYSEELADQICEMIATSEKGLNAIAKELGINRATIHNWLGVHKDFFDKYARAKELQADYMAEMILDISDDSKNDTIHTDKGDFEDKEWVNRSKLRVDTRKWLMSKLAPKKFGDKLDMTIELPEIPENIVATFDKLFEIDKEKE